MAKTLQSADYVLLGTLRKNGNMVETPVWFAEHEGAYYIFSSGTAGKVKRLRNFDTATLTPCTFSGKPLGDQHPASAQLLHAAADVELAHKALLHRYGWQMKITDFFSGLAGKIPKRQYIKVTLNTPASTARTAPESSR